MSLRNCCAYSGDEKRQAFFSAHRNWNRHLSWPNCWALWIGCRFVFVASISCNANIRVVEMAMVEWQWRRWMSGPINASELFCYNLHANRPGSVSVHSIVVVYRSNGHKHKIAAHYIFVTPSCKILFCINNSNGGSITPTYHKMHAPTYLDCLNQRNEFIWLVVINFRGRIYSRNGSVWFRSLLLLPNGQSFCAWAWIYCRCVHVFVSLYKSFIWSAPHWKWNCQKNNLISRPKRNNVLPAKRQYAA